TIVLYNYGMNFMEPAMAKVWQAGFKEKTFTTDGTTINYVEGPDNGLPLLLIHGQLVQWESYQLALPELSQHFHVFAVDCHGHGKSSHEPEKYTARGIGADLAVFIEQVIGEPAIVSGNSSGGLLAVWLAANSPQNVLGVVLEDPPLFSSEYPRIKDTAAWDTMETAHEFLMQTEEDEYLYYYLWNSGMMALLGNGRQGIYNWSQAYREKHPGELIEIFFFPLSIRMGTRGLQRYDPYFGQAFYDGSWNKDFDHAEALSRVKCPAILMHANWCYDDNGILMGAMSGEDADLAISLMSNARLERVNSGHATHIEDPELLIRNLIDFDKQLQASGY
ncbi:MAG: alpha/beta hydrolase, partial [Anaerolineaceae bacterium]|nr:alpha/beta hydrolase [Anaerolineaceae bacterium]